MGSVLPQYAVVSVGSTAAFINFGNVGLIDGKVLVGNGSTVNSNTSTPNGRITGGFDVSGAVSGNLFSNLGPPPAATHDVSATVGMQASSDATALSQAAADLMATQTFTSLNFGRTLIVDGKPGLNVIDGSTINGGSHVVIEGTSNDVFNISNTAIFNPGAIELKGVKPSQILWNFTLTTRGTAVLTTNPGGFPSQAPDLFGTFLATNGTNFQLNSMTLTGALIDIGGAINVLGSSTTPPFTNITHEPFAPAVIPEPGTLLSLGTGLIGIAEVLRRKLKLGRIRT